MEINSLARKVLAEQVPLERLAASTKLTQEEKIIGVSQHFEAILLRQFLTEAQKPLLNSKNSMSGAAGAIYQDMIVNNLADAISKTRSFGLARSFQAQILPHQQPNAENGKSASPVE